MSQPPGTLRVAAREDLPALLEAERKSFPGGAQDEWLLAPLVMDRAAWLYEDAASLLGYALIMARSSSPGTAFLFSFAVLPDARGRGVGRAFFTALREALTARGFQELELYVAPGNEAALRIYRGGGLREVAHHAALFGPGEDRLELRGGL